MSRRLSKPGVLPFSYPRAPSPQEPTWDGAVVKGDSSPVGTSFRDCVPPLLEAPYTPWSLGFSSFCSLRSSFLELRISRHISNHKVVSPPVSPSPSCLHRHSLCPIRQRFRLLGPQTLSLPSTTGLLLSTIGPLPRPVGTPWTNPYHVDPIGHHCVLLPGHLPAEC